MFPTVRFVLMMYLRSYYKKRNTPLCTPASVIQEEINTLEEILHYTQSLATHILRYLEQQSSKLSGII